MDVYMSLLFLCLSINQIFIIIVAMSMNLSLQNYSFTLLISKDLQKCAFSQGPFDKSVRKGSLHSTIPCRAVYC